MKIRHVLWCTAIGDQWVRYAALPAGKAEKMFWTELETTHKAWDATSGKIVSTVAIDSPQARRDAIDLPPGRGTENFENVRGVLPRSPPKSAPWHSEPRQPSRGSGP